MHGFTCLRPIAVLAVCLTALPVSAAPLLWTIDSPLVLNSGATVTGSFVYDADLGLHSSLLLTTSGSSADGLYDALVTPTGSGGGLIAATDALVDWTGATSLDLGFTSALTNAGGTVSVFSVGIATCDNSLCSSLTLHPSDQASIFSGDVGTVTASPVPVPAAALLFGSALGLLARIKRRAARDSGIA